MKKLMILVLAALSLSGFSQTKNFIDQNYIEVTGKAEMELVPNEIYLNIILNEKDYKGKENLELVEKSMIEKLTKLGIDVSKDLAVKDMASNFRRYWIKSSEINAISVYELKVGDAATAGSVMQELETIAISNITIERLDHSEIQKFREEVKIEAIQAAKKKAEYLANAIDQTCGRAIYIQESNQQVYNAYANSNIAVRGGNSFKSGKPEIEFQTIKLEYSILVRFELK